MTADEEINLTAVNEKLLALEDEIKGAKDTHNRFLRELGLPFLP